MTLLVQREFRVKRPHDEPELIRLARALASAAADEPGTLRYQWFVTEGVVQAINDPGKVTIQFADQRRVLVAKKPTRRD